MVEAEDTRQEEARILEMENQDVAILMEHLLSHAVRLLSLFWRERGWTEGVSVVRAWI